MKITLAAGFVSNSTDFRQIGSCSALFPFQIPEIDRDRSKNIIHQASCFILGPWNIVSISGHQDRQGVAQHPSHYDRWNPMTEYDRGCRMPVVMKPDHLAYQEYVIVNRWGVN
jgi:hypothetical protein